MLLKTLGCSLVYTEYQKEYFGRWTSAFRVKDSPREVAKVLWSSRTIHIHPDGFEEWLNILNVLHAKHPLSFSLIVISGSDYTITDDHMNVLLDLFPTATYFVQNYIGSDPRCHILPIGSFYSLELDLQAPKRNDLVITYFDPNNSDERKLLALFLAETPELQVYQHEKQTKDEYLTSLRQARFSLCPTGNGYDTMRFWESLALGAVPIVLVNEFTLRLREEYPNLPFVLLPSWQHILPWLHQGSLEDLYIQLRNDYKDFSPCTLDYWLTKCSLASA